MGYVKTNGKNGRPRKGFDSQGNPVQPPQPEPSGPALSVAEARRKTVLLALERDLAAIDRTPSFGMDGQPMPAHIRQQRAEGRQGVVEKIERIRALTGYELVAEFAPESLPRAEPPPEQPLIFGETLARGAYYAARGVKGAPVVEADPTFMAKYHERQAVQAVEEERQRQIKAGTEAIALAAVGG